MAGDIPRLPMNGNGDAGDWGNMNPDDKQLPAIRNAETDVQTTEADNNSAEKKERNEAEKRIDRSSTREVYIAAEAIGKPVDNAFDVYDWSEEDKKKLADKLDELAKGADASGDAGTDVVPVTGEGNGSSDAGEGDDADNGEDGEDSEDGDEDDDEDGDDSNSVAPIYVNGAVVGGAAGAIAGGALKNASEGDNADTGEGDDSADAEEGDGADTGEGDGSDNGGDGADNNTEGAPANNEKKNGLKRRLIKCGAALLATAGIMALIFSGGSNNKNGNIYPSHTIEHTDKDKDVDDQNEKAEDAEENEAYHFADEYGLFNDFENKSSDHAWMNAADLVESLIADGKIEVTKNDDGTFSFADKEAAYREFLTAAFSQNVEEAGTYMGYARNAGYFTDRIANGTIQDGERYCESIHDDKDAQQDLINEWRSLLDQSTISSERITGIFENNLMKNKNEKPGETDRSKKEIHSYGEGEACYTKTSENNMPVINIKLPNGNSFYVKFNLDDYTITQNEDGDYDVVLKDAYGNEWHYCAQPMVPEGKPTPNKDTTEITDNPTVPTPEKPTPENPTPEKPTPENPTPEAKAPFVQEEVDRGLDGLTVTQEEQTDAVEETVPTMAEFHEETQNDGSTGAEVNEVAPDTNVQVGAQDTSEKSADGSGRTVQEVVEQAEEVGGADDTITAEQVNRTEEDQKHQEEVQAGVEAQKAADEAYAKNAEEIGETATVNEDGSVTMTNENGQKSNQELVDMMLNGDI